jgi:hypothetical protein
VPGVIVDLRGNFGGSDELSADLCGFFYTAPSFYEYQEYYDKRNGKFLRITVGVLSTARKGAIIAGLNEASGTGGCSSAFRDMFF